MEKEIKIALVDDHALFRNGMRGLIDGKRNCRVVAEASDGSEFLENEIAMAADVVAKTLQVQGLDIDMNVLQKLLNETYTHYSDDELNNINAFANQRFIIEGKKRINELEAEISKVEALYQGDKIGKTARDARITELKEYKNAILRSIAEKENNGLFSEDIKEENA